MTSLHHTHRFLPRDLQRPVEHVFTAHRTQGVSNSALSDLVKQCVSQPRHYIYVTIYLLMKLHD